MKTIILRNGLYIKLISNWLKLYHTASGKTYFRFRGSRIYLEKCRMITDPIRYSWEDEDGISRNISYDYVISFFNGYLIEEHPDGGVVRIWTENWEEMPYLEERP